MISWERLSNLLTPSFWLAWLWRKEETNLDGYDHCSKCNRFLSLHSKNDGYCSYHNVDWAHGKERPGPYSLFRNSYDMWLRSRCGGNLDEAQISSHLVALSGFLDYAMLNSPAIGNMYDFCDEAFCDYQLMFNFLEDMKLQAKEKHSVQTELRICDALHRFIEFRKFQLPIKGIIENKYSATERLLESYKALLVVQTCDKLLIGCAITRRDIDLTVEHFLPQYSVIIDYFVHWDNIRSIEDGCDLDFATSFVAAYLYSVMPEQYEYLHMVRVRDLCLGEGDQLTFSSSKRLTTELDRFVSCYDLPSPTIASSCISKLQKCMAIDARTRDIVMAYIRFIRPRITRANDYLLLNKSALGLSIDQLEQRIATLVFRVTGKVTSLVTRFTIPVDLNLTPILKQNSGIRRRGGVTLRQSKKVSFGAVASGKILKRYLKDRQRKIKRKLVLDLTPLSQTL